MLILYQSFLFFTIFFIIFLSIKKLINNNNWFNNRLFLITHIDLLK